MLDRSRSGNIIGAIELRFFGVLPLKGRGERELSKLSVSFAPCALVAALCVCAFLCPPAFAEDGEKPDEEPLTSKLEIPTQEDEYMLSSKDGEIIRVAPKGIYIKDTDVEAGYVTTITGKHGVIWINKVQVEGPTGAETKQRVEIYAEGDVIIIQEDIASGKASKCYCKQLYFDMHNRKGVMLDAWLKIWEPGEDFYIYLTAQKVRQFGTGDINKTKLKVYNARVTNDEYGRPVMYLDAPSVEINSETHRPPTHHRPSEITSIKAYNIVAKIRGIPFLYLPFAAGSTMNRYFLRSITAGSSSRYGTFVLTKWDLQRMGLLDNDWDKLRLRADYYSKRGPAVGFDYEYSRPDYYGLLQGYFVKDTGKDRSGSDRIEPSTSNRGRIRLLHRHFLGDSWVADLEITKISDRGFMDEFMERELEEDKDQETLLYLHRTSGHFMVKALAKTEVNDFLTSTEYLPQVGASIVSLPIWGDRLYFSLDTQVASVRKDYDHRLMFHDERTVRGDINSELASAFGLWIFRVRPYIGIRGTFYDDTATQGSEQRLTGYAGINASTYFSKVYYDENGRPRMRHIIKPRLKVYSAFVNTTPPEDIVQYDSVDMVDRLTVTSIGLRQIFQTKRGPAGGRRSFDSVIIDMELNFYSDDDPLGYYFDPRTNGRIYAGSSFGRRISDNFKTEFQWNVCERFETYGEATYNFDSERFDLYEYGFRWYPNNVTSVMFRNYFIRNDGRSTFSSFTNMFQYNNSLENVVFPYGAIDVRDKYNIFEVDIGYEASEKWAFGIFVQYDADKSGLLDASFIIRRYFHVWVMDIVFERDNGDQDTRVTVSFTPRSFARGFVKKRSTMDTRGKATASSLPASEAEE